MFLELLSTKKVTLQSAEDDKLAAVAHFIRNLLNCTSEIKHKTSHLNGFPLFRRSSRRGDPASPYFVNSGYIFAPATSANDSEISSDATTDDSMSMTDSSV